MQAPQANDAAPVFSAGLKLFANDPQGRVFVSVNIDVGYDDLDLFHSARSLEGYAFEAYRAAIDRQRIIAASLWSMTEMRTD